ncbi:site-specific DNA-methyltransferase [Candidatus Thorarchaeota archaeon]|nr:MAG: site-specific DNA-methyltransferase [Candidatus Thorarchaeota archaeon]
MSTQNPFQYRNATVLHGDNAKIMNQAEIQAVKDAQIALTFLDPPFNQDKEYERFDDSMDEDEYWEWLEKVCSSVYRLTMDGGCIYFMQREKRAKEVLRTLERTGWILQNLIIWKKTTSAVPQRYRYGKHYQIIAFATKGRKPRIFNRLRIDYPLQPNQKIPRKNGIFVTDVWDDIREMTSGYFAGDEALREEDGERVHKQQSPVALLQRIILSSTRPDDVVLDPFAGSGTTLVVCNQLNRVSIGIEISKKNYSVIMERLKAERPADALDMHYYRFTKNLQKIVGEGLKLGRGLEQYSE